MDRFNRQTADGRIQLLQVRCFIGDTAMVLVLVQILRRRLPETTLRPYSVNYRLPDFFKLPCLVLLRFCEATFTSALANASASVLLVDMPDSIALVESGRSFTPHVNSP